MNVYIDKMFEAQALHYLKKYLGKYVEGVDERSLSISVWQGNVVLTNLRFRPEALEDLDFPVSVKAGLLGSLKLKAKRTTNSNSQTVSV